MWDLIRRKQSGFVDSSSIDAATQSIQAVGKSYLSHLSDSDNVTRVSCVWAVLLYKGQGSHFLHV